MQTGSVSGYLDTKMRNEFVLQIKLNSPAKIYIIIQSGSIYVSDEPKNEGMIFFRLSNYASSGKHNFIKACIF